MKLNHLNDFYDMPVDRHPFPPSTQLESWYDYRRMTTYIQPYRKSVSTNLITHTDAINILKLYWMNILTITISSQKIREFGPFDYTDHNMLLAYYKAMNDEAN